MSREREGFRDNLERIDAAFDHEWLNATEIAKWLGVKRETVQRHFHFNVGTKRISKADLARQMCAR